MSNWALVAAAFVLAGVVSWFATWALIPVLRRGAVLDRPNERSLHQRPTPRGGGIAVVAAIIAAWIGLIAAGQIPPAWLPVPWAAIGLAIVSWLDDLRGLSPLSRLIVQILAVAAGMAALPPGAVFQGWLPGLLDTVVAALAWVWFINLFNFMDGIDGIAGSEAAAIALGLLLFATVGVGRDPGVAVLSAAIIGASIGFLAWNWAPARIFMGDVGSVPLGYLLGFLLLGAASRGWWKIALILPLYFLADATITLVRRLLRGERIWQAHREHFYQRAAQGGLGHAGVVWRVVAADIVLIGCGWAAENGWGLVALAAAVLVVALLIAELARPR